MTSPSIDILAGQRLMAGFDGTDFNADLNFLITRLKVGGIILFSRNMGTPEQIARLCSDCQDAAASQNLPPLLVALDQEGGQVARLKPPFTQFPGNPTMTGEQDAIEFARITATELKGIGVNMDMAPVLDVAPPGIDSIMAGRAFGGDPQWVAKMGLAVISHLQRRGIMAVAKHFPGIGRTVLDSHLSLPDLDIDIRDLEASDLIPFKIAMAGQVAGIMLSHIRYARIDPVWPASLSPAITTGLLRTRMRYEGVVMTDDLDMGAIKPSYDIVTVVRQILEADVDIALICHKGPDIETAFDNICRLMIDNPRFQQMGQRSMQRIIDLKRTFLAGSWDAA